MFRKLHPELSAQPRHPACCLPPNGSAEASEAGGKQVAGAIWRAEMGCWLQDSSNLWQTPLMVPHVAPRNPSEALWKLSRWPSAKWGHLLLSKRGQTSFNPFLFVPFLQSLLVAFSRLFWSRWERCRRKREAWKASSLFSFPLLSQPSGRATIPLADTWRHQGLRAAMQAEGLHERTTQTASKMPNHCSCACGARWSQKSQGPFAAVAPRTSLWLHHQASRAPRGFSGLLRIKAVGRETSDGLEGKWPKVSSWDWSLLQWERFCLGKTASRIGFCREMRLRIEVSPKWTLIKTYLLCLTWICTNTRFGRFAARNVLIQGSHVRSFWALSESNRYLQKFGFQIDWWLQLC